MAGRIPASSILEGIDRDVGELHAFDRGGCGRVSSALIVGDNCPAIRTPDRVFVIVGAQVECLPGFEGAGSSKESGVEAVISWSCRFPTAGITHVQGH